MIKQIPEVANVLGKIGRVDSALDPAPAAMVETYVMLKPRAEWREGMTERMIWDEINSVATITGITPASALQPIEGRVVMLQSGIKASMAVRVYGDDLDGLSKASIAVAEHLDHLFDVLDFPRRITAFVEPNTNAYWFELCHFGFDEFPVA